LIWLHIIKSLNNKNNYMVQITIYLSILTLNSNGLNSPIKDTFSKLYWKGKIQQFVYKRPILLTEVNTGLRWKAGTFTKPMAPQNRQE
jgi:hypothetical protein